MRNKKAEMGMGTLIIFIAMILVAAVAASVLIATTTKLQNKALDTGKLTTAEVGTGLQAVEVFAEDGSDQNLDYFYETIKLSAGSDALRFRDVLLTLSLSNTAKDYSYGTTAFTVEVINDSYTGVGTNITLPAPDCDNVTLNLSVHNFTSFCYIANGSDTTTTTCRSNVFGVKYQITGSSYKSGYLNKGDVVKICFASPRAVNESEDIKISLIPKVGSNLVIETTTPDLMVDKRVTIFP